MNALNPIGLALALLAIPIVLLYLLRLRRREQRVSSTLLWRQTVMDREANALWQRLRPNILLLLQLLTLAFLVFALTRPYALAPAGLTGRAIVLLDASASMEATDVAPSRFEAARRGVRGLIDGLGTTDEMTIILVDGSPRALTPLTSSRADLYAALEQARTSLAPANWSAALSLAGALRTPSTSIVIIGDGANSDDLKAQADPAQFRPVGGAGANIAISAFALRQTVRGASALARVTNHGSQDATVLLSLRAGTANGTATSLLDARELQIAAGQSAQWTVNGIDPAAAYVRASIDRVAPAESNVLSADDMAWAVNAAPAPRRALLLSRGNRFLEQALGALPNLQVTRAISMPIDFAQPYDLIVVDGISATLPARSHALFVNPIADTPVFSLGAVFSATGFVDAAQHPTLLAVDWRGINVLDARRVAGPGWLLPVVNAQGGPLMLAGESPAAEGRTPEFERLAILPFDLRRSDLPLQIAFPVLIANTVEWLAPLRGLDVPISARPGEALALPVGASVVNPAGARQTVDARGYGATGLPGMYSYALGAASGLFAVNFLDARESAIVPDPEVALRAAGTATDANGLQVQLSQREIWPFLAALALVALLVEWWIYQRGMPALRRRTGPDSRS
ncbi:MAG: VWA domain-containing protein [Thermoflexales bacterium]